MTAKKTPVNLEEGETEATPKKKAFDIEKISKAIQSADTIAEVKSIVESIPAEKKNLLSHELYAKMEQLIKS